MNDRERKALAEQLEANPLCAVILDEIEQAALDALVMADTEQGRVEAQWRVRAVRTFRQDWQAALASTPRREGAFA